MKEKEFLKETHFYFFNSNTVLAIIFHILFVFWFNPIPTRTAIATLILVVVVISYLAISIKDNLVASVMLQSNPPYFDLSFINKFLLFNLIYLVCIIMIKDLLLRLLKTINHFSHHICYSHFLFFAKSINWIYANLIVMHTLAN